MTRPSVSSRPRLARGCRLSDSSKQPVTLQMPEGALRLSGPGLKIVQSCDGNHTIAEIVGELQALYPSAEARRIEEDTLGFLEKLQEKRAVDF